MFSKQLTCHKFPSFLLQSSTKIHPLPAPFHWHNCTTAV